MISDDEDSDTMDDTKYDKETISKTSADGVKLGNLLKRHRVYGDITQNATESQLERLLVSISDNIIAKLGRILLEGLKQSENYHMFSCFQVLHDNNVPKVIESLEEWVCRKRTRTYIPPAFFDRDGTFVQPPSFEMPAYIIKDGNKLIGLPKSSTFQKGKQLG